MPGFCKNDNRFLISAFRPLLFFCFVLFFRYMWSILPPTNASINHLQCAGLARIELFLLGRETKKMKYLPPIYSYGNATSTMSFLSFMNTKGKIFQPDQRYKFDHSINNGNWDQKQLLYFTLQIIRQNVNTSSFFIFPQVCCTEKWLGFFKH